MANETVLGPPIGFATHVAQQLLVATDRETVDRLVDEIGLPHPLLKPGDTRLTLLQEAAFFQGAADAAGDLDFGFHCGLALEIGTTLPAFIFAHSHRLEDALRDAVRFHHLVRPGIRAEMIDLGNVITLRGRFADPALHAYPRYGETIFAGVIGHIRAFTARPFHPEALYFTHHRRPVCGELRARLGCSPQFGAEHTEMLLPQLALTREICGRSDALRAILIEHCEMLERQAHERGMRFSERVELCIQKALPNGTPSADAVAASLGVSRRTLSRRLNDAGTTFSALLETVRLKRAASELRDTDARIGEIAWRLGYGSQAAFSTAFRRATGKSPREFRASPPSTMAKAI